ncbi:MAG: glycosyltransferase family 2 protein [Alphaproteobacteria bacterium]
MAKVTVGLPVYNGDKYLDKALESLCCQSFDDFEILISDNASTDKTPDIISKWQEQSSKIKYFRQNENLGMVGNFDWVFNNASSPFFILAAHDDLWSKDYVKELYETMVSNDGCLLAVPKVIKTNPDGSENLVTPFNDRIDEYKGTKRVKKLLRWAQSGWVYGIFNKEELIKANKATKVYGFAWGNEFITMLPFLLSGKVFGNNNAIYYQRQTGLSEDRYKPKNLKEQYKLYKSFLRESLNILKTSKHSAIAKARLFFAILKYTDKHAWKIRRLIRSLVFFK